MQSTLRKLCQSETERRIRQRIEANTEYLDRREMAGRCHDPKYRQRLLDQTSVLRCVELGLPFDRVKLTPREIYRRQLDARVKRLQAVFDRNQARRKSGSQRIVNFARGR